MNIARATGWTNGGLLGHARSLAIEGWAGAAVTAAAVVATVAVIAAVLTRPGSRLAAALSSPPAVEVGRRSYGIYLYHWPIFIFLGLRTPAKALGLGIPLSLAAAWISYAFVERPFLRLKQRWSANDPGRRTCELTGIPVSHRVVEPDLHAGVS